ncbi:MAG: DUF2017 family protein [Actinomycetes bacterium]
MANRLPIRRKRNGRYSVQLDASVRALLVSVADQLRDLLLGGDPALVRLFPPPYGDDAERNEGYAALVVPELTDRRLAALELLRTTAYDTEIDRQQLEAWMRCINDARLVAGTVLDVDESSKPPTGEHPEADLYATYEFLGYVLEVIVQALSS